MKLFFEFIGFMVFKTTGSISGLRIFFSVLKKMNFSRRYKQKGEIEKELNREYLRLRCAFY